LKVGKKPGMERGEKGTVAARHPEFVKGVRLGKWGERGGKPKGKAFGEMGKFWFQNRMFLCEKPGVQKGAVYPKEGGEPGRRGRPIPL